MAGYEVDFDTGRGVVLCRIMPGLCDYDLPGLSRDLTAAVAEARAVGPLRALWDNRAGRMIPPATATAIRVILVDPMSMEDRVAVLVPDSLAKARARPQMDAISELFASENAAMTWLKVGTRVAAV